MRYAQGCFPGLGDHTHRCQYIALQDFIVDDKYDNIFFILPESCRVACNEYVGLCLVGFGQLPAVQVFQLPIHKNIITQATSLPCTLAHGFGN